MADCVQFATTSSSPRAIRSTNVPAPNNHSIAARLKIQSYADFNQFVIIRGTSSSNLVAIYASAIGELYVFRQIGATYQEQLLWSDSYTGWFDLVQIGDTGGVHVSTRRAGDSWTDHTSLAQASFTAGNIDFCGYPPTPADINGTMRFGKVEIFNTGRPNSTSDLAGARAYLKSSLDTRTLSGGTGAVFTNQCTTAASFGTDATSTGNLTITGSPTTEADDPYPDPQGVGSITATSTITGVSAGTSTADGAIAATVTVTGASAGVGLGAGAITATVAATGVGASRRAGAGAITATVSATALARAPHLLLSASGNGRHLVNAYGDPVFVLSDAAWSAIVALTAAEQIEYLDDRQAKGFNAIIVELIEHLYGPNPPRNTDNQLPFTGTAFQTALNETYWLRVDEFLKRCLERDIIVIANPAFAGNQVPEGWRTEMTAASTGQMQSYGATLGTRYKNYDNLIWVLYGDIETQASKYSALATGLLSTDDRHTLYSAHYGGTLSTHEGTFQSYFTFNFLYSGPGDFAVDADDGWAADIGPGLGCECDYEAVGGSIPVSDLLIRVQFYEAIVSGALGGFGYGAQGVWGFNYNTYFVPTLSPWQNYLDLDGAIQCLIGKTFFESIAWTELVSEVQSASFVTAGRGTYGGNSWVPAARNATNTLAVLYVPGGGSVTVNMSLMAGTVTARWFDPADGSYTAATGSPFANSGTHAFVASSEVGNNGAGDADWVLLLEAPDPSTDGAGAVSATCVVTGVGKGLAASVGAISATCTATAVGSSRAAAAGSVTATVALTAVGPQGAGALTATSTVVGVGSALSATVGAVSCTGSVTGVGARLAAAAGAVAVAGTVAGAGSTFTPVTGAGALSISCSVAAVGVSAVSAIGSIGIQCNFTATGAALAGCSGSILSSVIVSGSRGLFSSAAGEIVSECTVLGTSISEVAAPPNSTMTIAAGPSSSMTIA